MAIARDNYFAHEDLSHYSLRQRVTIRLASFLFYWGISLIGRTIRFEADGLAVFDQLRNEGRTPILAFWHDRIFLATYYFRNRAIVVISSQSFDGECMARLIQRLGYGAIRGSSSRGGGRALVEMIRAMRGGLTTGFTVDGPRGPRHVAKPGAVMLAKKTGNPVVPFTVEPAQCWTLGSWDKMQIPRPFTRARVIVADPIYVPSDASDDLMAAKLAEVQAALDRLSSTGSAESTLAANNT
jgi:lysophospholipid acyltransferase (LPLAT)-like uncharacterized protein